MQCSTSPGIFLALPCPVQSCPVSWWGSSSHLRGSSPCNQESSPVTRILPYITAHCRPSLLLALLLCSPSFTPLARFAPHPSPARRQSAARLPQPEQPTCSPTNACVATTTPHSIRRVRPVTTPSPRLIAVALAPTNSHVAVWAEAQESRQVKRRSLCCGCRQALACRRPPRQHYSEQQWPTPRPQPTPAPQKGQFALHHCRHARRRPDPAAACL